jgi:predicted RNase H-like HicB family nuclease
VTDHVVCERGPRRWGAYVPDPPGCVAAGDTRAEVETLIREAIQLHIKGLREDGEAVPKPASEAGTVAIPAAA